MDVTGTVLSLLVRAATPIAARGAERTLVVQRMLKVLGVDAKAHHPAYEVAYLACVTSVLHGRSRAVARFFCDRYVRQAFVISAQKYDPERFRAEINSTFERNRETGEYGRLPSLERLYRYAADIEKSYDEIIDAKKAPEVRAQDRILDDLQAQVLRLAQAADKVPTPALKISPQSSGRESSARRTVFGADGWTSTLGRLYPDLSVLQFGRSHFPIWAHAASIQGRSGIDDLDAPLGRLDAEMQLSDKDYALGVCDDSSLRALNFDPAGRSEFDTYVERGGSRAFHNDTAYGFSRLRWDSDGSIKIDAHLTNYFTSVATSEVLEAEFLAAQAQDPSRPVSLRSLPRRAWLHRQVAAACENTLSPSSVPFDGRFRSAALSVSAVIILKRDDGSKCAFVLRRSEKVRTHAGMWHVVPSGIFSPVNRRWQDPRHEFSVKQAVFREYAEELFGYEDFEREGGESGLQVLRVPPVKRLCKAVEAGDVAVRYTGLSIPLLTLRPEFCVLIYIINPDWFASEVGRSQRTKNHRLQPNWEYLNIDGARHDSTQLDLDDDFNPSRWDRINPTSLVPNAAAALSLAARAARSIEAQS